MGSSVRVKICGITCVEDALDAGYAGADILGFILVKGTPRHIEPESVKKIVKELRKKFREEDRPGISVLFSDPASDPAELAGIIAGCGADHVQFHGDESPEYCARVKERSLGLSGRGIRLIKTFKVKAGIMKNSFYSMSDYGAADHFLFDTYVPGVGGGTGENFNWKVLKEEKKNIDRPYFIAGGLDPGNVRDAVRETEPFGVDVSSGVETSPGRKDKVLVEEFIKNAKRT